MDVEQGHHQVRLGWGRHGLAAVAPDADVVVWVDVLPGVDVPTWPTDADVLACDLVRPSATAAWIVARQRELARRLTVAVVAAGRSDLDGGYAVEDHLAAGALVAALGDLGIDATSPDAAVAEAAYRSLRSAVGHLVSASTNGRAAGVDPAALRAAAEAPAAEPLVIQEAADRPA